MGCELSPSCPVADYYTLEDGGSAQSSDTQASSAKGVDDATAKNAAADAGAAGAPPPLVPHAQPTDAQGNQNLTKPSETQSASDSSTLGTKMNEKGELESTGQRSEQETKDIKSALDF